MPKFFFFFVVIFVVFLANCGQEVVKSDPLNNNNDYNNSNNNDDPETCGNGKWDFGEECDGSKVPTCAIWHNDSTVDWEGGIICNSSCEVVDLCRDPDEDDDNCDNDGYWEPSRGEQCDGDDVPECTDLPEYSQIPSGYKMAGSVYCSNCRLVPNCYLIEDDEEEDDEECNNNGYWQPSLGEECDGYDSPYYYCSEMPDFGSNWSGTVTCNNCKLVPNCVWTGDDEPECGDGHVDPAYNEECDGTNLDGVSCQAFGFSTGTLRCDAWCQYDVSACE